MEEEGKEIRIIEDISGNGNHLVSLKLTKAEEAEYGYPKFVKNPPKE